MCLLRAFFFGLVIFLMALPVLCAQEGGQQYDGRRGGNGGSWRGRGGRGNWNRQAVPNPAPSAQDDSKSNISSTFSSSSGSTGKVPGFGVEKKHEMVSGFGAAKKESSKKTISSNATGDVKSPPNAKPSSPDARLLDRIREQAKSLLNQYDDNKNGKLEREEWSKMHSRLWAADQNHDGVITLDELTAYFSQLNNVRAPIVGKASSRTETSAYSSGSGTSSRKPYHFRTATERLPEGLPDWFARKDADGDGQVAMAEYAVSWDDAKVREFRRLDSNNDGIITPKECLKAEGR